MEAELETANPVEQHQEEAEVLNPEEPKERSEESPQKMSPPSAPSILSTQQTPVRIHSMIPVSARAMKIRQSLAFETPSSKDVLRHQEDDYFRQRRILDTPIPRNSYDFVSRIETEEMNRKKKLEEIKAKEEMRIRQQIENTRVTPAHRSLSKKEIMSLNERLAPITPRRVKEESEVEFVPKTPSNNPKVFKRLFVQSTAKKPAPVIEEKEEEHVKSMASQHSIQIAVRRDINQISSVIGERETGTLDEFQEVLRELKILDETLLDFEVALIERATAKCKTAENEYNLKKLKKSLFNAVRGKKTTRFHKLVASRIALSRINEKKAEAPSESEEMPMTPSSKMHKDTLRRLLASKPAIEVEEEPEEITSALSDSSKAILMKSERAKELDGLDLATRDQVLAQKRTDEILKLSKEVEEKETAELVMPTGLGSMPSFYSKIPKVNRIRSKFVEEPAEEPKGPKVDPLEHYRKVRALQESKSVKPVGWEATVERIRLGRIERNSIQQALDIRAAPDKVNRIRYADPRRPKKAVEEVQQEHIEELDAIDDVLGL